MEEIEVLLLGYNRANFIVENLNKLSDLNINNVSVSIDGPKNQNDSVEQKKIKEIVYTKSLIKKYTQQKVNRGIIKSIPFAIDEFYKTSDKNVLILEDDVILSKSSLEFIETHKHRLKSEPNLFFISLNSPCDQFIQSSYYSDFPYIWGWYISKKKWEEYRNFKQKYILLKIFKKYFLHPSSLIYWTAIYILMKLNILKSWDYDLVFYIICSNKQVLVPKYNLTKNIGFSNQSTHTKENFKKDFVNYSFSNEEVNFDNDAIRSRDFKITKLENRIVFDVSFRGFIKKVFRKIRVI